MQLIISFSSQKWNLKVEFWTKNVSKDIRNVNLLKFCSYQLILTHQHWMRLRLDPIRREWCARSVNASSAHEPNSSPQWVHGNRLDLKLHFPELSDSVAVSRTASHPVERLPLLPEVTLKIILKSRSINRLPLSCGQYLDTFRRWARSSYTALYRLNYFIQARLPPEDSSKHVTNYQHQSTLTWQSIV